MKASVSRQVGCLKTVIPPIGSRLYSHTQPFLHFRRMGPPRRLPKRFSQNMGRFGPSEVQSRSVYLNQGPVKSQQSDKLKGLLEDGPEFCPALLQIILRFLAVGDVQHHPNDPRNFT